MAANNLTATIAERTLIIERVFDAPRALAFETWVAPEHVARWWGPRGFTTLSCEMDLRPGGTWRVSSRSPEGDEHAERGVYREIVAPERLVFTHAWEDEEGRPGHETLVMVTFAELGGKTKVTFHQADFESVTSRDGHEEGWSSAFDLLDEYLPKAQIRERIESWTRALHAKDVDGVMSHYTPDILTFDLAPPLQHAGDEYRRGFEEWFRTFRGPIALEIRDLRITAGEDVAFTHSLNRISGARTSGEDTDVWVRATICFRKTDGRWLVAHEHLSVPFYMDGSVRAAVDLKP